MRIIKTNFLERVKLTETVESFRFQPDEPVSFVPGQFSRIMFDPVNQDNKDLNKYLSFSASPSKGYLEFTKRLSLSDFSRRLQDLKPGQEVSLSAPLGNCVLKPEYKKIAFVIGGIGITPVMSMLEYMNENKAGVDAALFYSNRLEEDIAFKSRIDFLVKNLSGLKVVYNVTGCQPKSADCFFGMINKDFLSSQLSDWDQREVFIFGPPKMVEAMKAVCLEAGCSRDNLKTEGFVGY
jgi:ferredoxin-NADP reductase